MVVVRKKFVRGSLPVRNGKPHKDNTSKPRKGKAKNGESYASGIPTAARIEANPELLAGTGRGNPGCGGLKIDPRKRPAFVVVTEGENGAIRATVHGCEVTGILRLIGKAGFKWQVAATWLTRMAIPLRRNTIVSQVSAGAGYDPKRWAKEGKIDTLRGPIPTDVPASVMALVKQLAKGEPTFRFDV